MSDDTVAPLLFLAIGRKKVTAAFDGDRITSDGGVMLLAAAERRIGVADRLAGLITDPRNPLFVTHSVAEILRARMLVIACGYEDADDLDLLRTDPASSSPVAVCQTAGATSAQATQEPTRLRPHQLPLRPGQPGSRGAAHRRLLADADSARRHPQTAPLATAEFATLGMRPIKIAGRITETATRVRIAFAAACPEIMSLAMV